MNAPRLPYVVAVIAALSAIALAVAHFREKTPETPVVRATILPPDKTVLGISRDTGPAAVSPDGRRLAFSARSIDGGSQLYVRSLDAVVPQPLGGSEGGTYPFWSPDSRSIGFYADGKLKRIDATGGPSLTLCDAPQGAGGTWSRDGVIIFSPRLGTLQRVSAAGGFASPVDVPATAPASGVPGFPWFLPDGRHFLYSTVPGATKDFTIHIASLDSKENTIVGKASSSAIYAEGYLLYLVGTTLMAQPLDWQRMVTTAPAIPLTEQVQFGSVSVSNNGLLVYQVRRGQPAYGMV